MKDETWHEYLSRKAREEAASKQTRLGHITEPVALRRAEKSLALATKKALCHHPNIVMTGSFNRDRKKLVSLRCNTCKFTCVMAE